MRLDRKFIIVVACSLVWAAMVSAVFYRVAASSSKPAAGGGERILVVAAQSLPLGAIVKPEFVKTVRVPDRLFPAGGSSKVEEIADRPVISPILEGEPVLEGRLAARGSGLGLAPMIPPGMRAISVRVNDVVGVAGFVLPGMRVDVLVTGRPPGRETSVTTTALQNIMVLSAGQTLQADAKAQPINAPVVTLLVNPMQAEVLTLANNEGRIQLVLRNSTDQQTEKPPGSEMRDLYGLNRGADKPVAERPRESASRAPRVAPVPVVKPTPAAVPPPMNEEVMVIRGSQKTLESPPAGGVK